MLPLSIESRLSRQADNKVKPPLLCHINKFHFNLYTDDLKQFLSSFVNSALVKLWFVTPTPTRARAHTHTHTRTHKTRHNQIDINDIHDYVYHETDV